MKARKKDNLPVIQSKSKRSMSIFAKFLLNPNLTVYLLQIALFFNFVHAQQIKPHHTDSTITVVPGAEYDISKFSQFFLGAHWRQLWTTPVKVPVLDLEKFAGGLIPFKRGGGFQTKSLHFKANNGRYYKFRSLNKDPSKVLPVELRESFVADVVKDQISTSHPLSAIIVAPLLNAVEVLNAEPIITYLPDSELLLEYRADFKNLLGTLEENPKDDTDPEQIFAGADKIVNDYEIFEELEENNDDQVDAAEYLKARLMDIFLGDWDRHVGQWKWARFRTNGKKIWKPIPRDRDQAFSLYDGLFPWIISLSVTQIEGFAEGYPQINDLTWSGRHLDRRFLVSIDKPAWDSVTAFVKQRLTDRVIENAVKKLPHEMYQKSGANLIRMLKKRRDRLNQISERYYRMISKYVSIWLSDKAEVAEINRIGKNRVEVAIFKRDNKTAIKDTVPFFYRVFNKQHTKDIRIYLQGGDDRAVVKGVVNSSIPVLVIGGSGADQLIDSSNVKGYFLSLLPFADSETKTEFYDSDNSTQFVKGPGTKIDKTYIAPPPPYDEDRDQFHARYEPPVRDWGHDWKPGFWLDYSSDDGLLLGGGPILYEFDFRTEPFSYRMELLAGYATAVSSYRLDYSAEFYSIIKGLRTSIHASKTELAYNRFYGLGNETSRDEQLEENNYYRIAQELNLLSLAFDRPVLKLGNLAVEIGLKNSQLEKKQNTILSDPSYINYKGTDDVTYLSIASSFKIDTRDHPGFPRRGLLIDLSASVNPDMFDNKNSYFKTNFDFRYYLSLANSTLALRLLAQKIWEDYFFFDAAKLGGKDNLRGFSRERFSGDAALFTALELRQPLLKSKIIIPAWIGLSCFVETGRVHLANESSNRWHACYGGGFWISYLKDTILLSTSLANSAEDISFYLTTGFMF